MEMVRQRLWIVARSVAAGWAVLIALTYLAERPLLRLTAPVVGAQWEATASLALACLELLVKMGMPRANITVTDIKGVVYKGRREEMDPDKDRFAIDLEGKTVTCPAGITVAIRARAGGRHAGQARFGAACHICPLAAQCTTAGQGRTITIGPYEARLAAAREAQASPAWQASYKATRPKVERKIGHLMRRRHGGRRARVRGQLKVAADFALLAAAANLAWLAVLGATADGRNWAAAST